MELIRYKVKGDTVMGVLVDCNRNLGVYYTIEKLGKMIPEGSHWMQPGHPVRRRPRKPACNEQNSPEAWPKPVMEETTCLAPMNGHFAS